MLPLLASHGLLVRVDFPRAHLAELRARQSELTDPDAQLRAQPSIELRQSSSSCDLDDDSGEVAVSKGSVSSPDGGRGTCAGAAGAGGGGAGDCLTSGAGDCSTSGAGDCSTSGAGAGAGGAGAGVFSQIRAKGGDCAVLRSLAQTDPDQLSREIKALGFKVGERLRIQMQLRSVMESV